jgi:hypothetical protein
MKFFSRFLISCRVSHLFCNFWTAAKSHLVLPFMHSAMYDSHWSYRVAQHISVPSAKFSQQLCSMWVFLNTHWTHDITRYLKQMTDFEKVSKHITLLEPTRISIFIFSLCGPGFDSREGQLLSLFFRTHRIALGPLVFLWIAHHSPYTGVEANYNGVHIKSVWSHTFVPTYAFSVWTARLAFWPVWHCMAYLRISFSKACNYKCCRSYTCCVGGLDYWDPVNGDWPNKNMETARTVGFVYENTV